MRNKCKSPHFPFPFILPVISLLISFILWFPKNVIAQEPNFAVTQEQIFQIHEDGNTTITENFTLTNLTSDFFPQEYLIRMANLKTSNLRAQDRLGPIQTTATASPAGNEIRLKFNDQVLGVGKILRFTLTFDTPDIARKLGRLWEVNILQPSKIPGLTNLAVRLIVPSSFGQKVFAKPEPGTADLFWNADNLKNRPINVVFSPHKDTFYQFVDYSLKYHLYNSRLYPVSMQIALPPDSQYQKIFLNQLTPKPTNVLLDKDGNWLAEYSLGPTQKLEVLGTGSAAIFLRPGTNSSTDENSYLKPEKYWPASDSQIKRIAKTLPTAQSIYDYVKNVLDYSPDRPNANRPGGRGILLAPTKANPQDFSDLFITLARANNIPSREIDGYLIGEKASRHIWPEFYDSNQKQWQMVDPTLSKITSSLDFFQTWDFSHFTLFIKNSDKTPILADDINIQPVERDLDLNSAAQALATANIPKQITAGFPATGQLVVENPGPTFFPSETLSLSGKTLETRTPIILTGDIPPFGHQELSIKILPASWNSQFDDIITLRFGYYKQDYAVKVIPLYKNGYLVIFGGLTALGIISILTQITRGLFLQKFKRGNHLRREG